MTACHHPKALRVYTWDYEPKVWFATTANGYPVSTPRTYLATRCNRCGSLRGPFAKRWNRRIRPSNRAVA